MSKQGHIPFTTAPAVDVWLVAIDAAIAPTRLRDLQPAHAQDRPARTVRQRERAAATAALVLLGGGDPGHWRREPDGRPVAPAGGAVSLSHAPGVAAVALAARGTRVGVDVERPREIAGLDGLARTAMSASEHRAWSAGDPADAPARFLRRWVRKEAVLKATGQGLRGDLRSVDVGDAGRIAALPTAAGDPAAWTVQDLRPPVGDAVLAVAVAAPRARIVLRLTTLPDLLETHGA